MRMLLGGILLAVGILIAGVSGLCSAAVLFDNGEFGGLRMWPAVLMFGGIPFAMGAGLGFGGWALIRKARRERALTDKDVSEIFK